MIASADPVYETVVSILKIEWNTQLYKIILFSTLEISRLLYGKTKLGWGSGRGSGMAPSMIIDDGSSIK